MTILQSYEYYFETGHYDERYPRPNRSTLARVMAIIANAATLLDIGAGNGRYAVPLAVRGYDVIAVERSDHARHQLITAAKKCGVSHKIATFKDIVNVDDQMIQTCRVALLLFGVLGHMRFGERRDILGWLRDRMPLRARVIGSVPNRYRRFFREQIHSRVDDEGAAHRFSYSRIFGGKVNILEYTVFSPGELRAELALRGWRVVDIAAESLLSEAAVTRSALLGRADELASRAAPPHVGYGMLYVAESNRPEAGTYIPERDSANEDNSHGIPRLAGHLL